MEITNILTKYPRTPHLPWSEGISEDDINLPNVEMFDGMNVVITEKMDGENTTITPDKVHARSLDSRDHPSRHMVKSLWSQICFNIPRKIRIVGENLYAKHTIFYEQLPAYFLAFAVFDNNICLSWEETKEWCQLLGLQHVPVLYDGPWNQKVTEQCYSGQSKCGGLQEGYVVRNADNFSFEQFNFNVAKFVRKNHVQTSEHWMMQKIVTNQLLNQRK